MSALNPLDPFVHRAVFQFWRANALLNAGFFEDAISALDGVTAVVIEAVHTWRGELLPDRASAAAALRMSAADSRSLDLLYKMRCGFGAHPPQSKWWDFGEVYDEAIDESVDVVRRLVGKLGALEYRHRRVDPNPSDWASWFADNAELLFDVVWFSKLPG